MLKQDDVASRRYWLGCTEIMEAMAKLSFALLMRDPSQRLAASLALTGIERGTQHIREALKEAPPPQNQTKAVIEKAAAGFITGPEITVVVADRTD